MHFGVDVGRVVREDVKHVMAFVFVRTDDAGIERHVVSHEGVGDHPFFEAEVLRGMPGIDRVDAGLELLTVAAGMERLADIVVAEKRQLCNGVSDELIGCIDRLQTDEVVRLGHQRMGSDVGNLAHLPRP